MSITITPKRKLDAEGIEKLLKFLREGCPLLTACKLVGIDGGCLKKQVESGRKGKELQASIDFAVREFEQRLILKACSGSAELALKVLAARYPAWSVKSQATGSGKSEVTRALLNKIGNVPEVKRN